MGALAADRRRCVIVVADCRLGFTLVPADDRRQVVPVAAGHRGGRAAPRERAVARSSHRCRRQPTVSLDPCPRQAVVAPADTRHGRFGTDAVRRPSRRGDTPAAHRLDDAATATATDAATDAATGAVDTPAAAAPFRLHVSARNRFEAIHERRFRGVGGARADPCQRGTGQSRLRPRA